MLTVKQIEDIKFRKANIGGYKTDDVDKFLIEIKTTVGKLQSENIELLNKIKILAQKVKECKDEEESVKIALVKAQKVADMSIKEAKQMADEIIVKAKKQAEKVLSDANIEIVNKKAELTEIKKNVKEFRSNILALYKDHIKLVNSFTADDRISEKMLEQMEKSAEEKVEKKETEESLTTKEPEVKNKSKFVDLKFGENYNVSTDTIESPIGLFNKVH